MCNCNEQETLVDITLQHGDFQNKLKILAFGKFSYLMECPECKQLWKVDEWDKYQTLYAIKIPSQENWEEFDSRSFIEQQILNNRGGLGEEGCRKVGCNEKQVKGSSFCAKHLYEAGSRK